ncbi:MAG: MBL fold metallo-hydrolase [Candidatus Saccharimonadales bacterium]
MEIKKYMHCCLVINNNQQSIVIDPGVWSDDFVPPTNTVGIIITHDHPDHFDLEKVHAVTQANPDVTVYSTRALCNQMTGLKTQPVQAGESMDCGQFNIKFTGGEHASVDTSFPPIINLGVIINHDFYYPGDSFTLVSVPIKTLAVPLAGPWMRTAEAIDFLYNIKPREFFTVHDEILSDAGRQTYNAWMEIASKRSGCDFIAYDKDTKLPVAFKASDQKI